MIALVTTALLAWPPAPMTVYRGARPWFGWCLADADGKAREIVLPTGEVLRPVDRAPQWRWHAASVGTHNLRFRIQRVESPDDGTALEYEQTIVVLPNARPRFGGLQ